MRSLQHAESFPVSSKLGKRPRRVSGEFICTKPAEAVNSDALLSELYGDVVRYLSVFGIHEAYLEDAVQDTMVQAIEGIGKVRDKSRIKYWLLKIAKRTGIRYIKASRGEMARRCSYEEYMNAKQETEKFISDKQLYAWANQISDENLIDILENDLNERERRVILLYYVYGHKFKEIARIMGEPESTVRSVSARSKAKIKKRLEQGGYRHGRQRKAKG